MNVMVISEAGAQAINGRRRWLDSTSRFSSVFTLTGIRSSMSSVPDSSTGKKRSKPVYCPIIGKNEGKPLQTPAVNEVRRHFSLAYVSYHLVSKLGLGCNLGQGCQDPTP